MILGKMAPYVVVSIVDVALVMVVAVFHFGMRIVGSVAVLGLNALIFLLGSLGLGLLVSTVSSNQMQATQLSTLLILPSILLSGYVFPFEAMPRALQFVGYTIPLTHFLQVLRGVILMGAGMDVLWRQAAIMSLHAVAILTLAVWRLRKRLD
ncbi:MAG: ABC transporter permease [Ignavibacteriales bacterium]